jgi:hypothetical protein
MTEYEQHQLFYQQFNTVVHNHQEWLHSPEGTLAVLRDPWKAQAPVVRIDHMDYADETKVKDVLKRLQARHTTAGTHTP